jgi:uncharacterized caspase-like protein
MSVGSSSMAGWRRWWWLLWWAAAGVAGAAAPESRVALVIGNAAYAQEPLRNPVNDARAIARSLRALGFTVLLHENATKKTMEQAVLDYGRRIAAGGVGLFFYAGHGMQVRGRNYLVPVDARIDEEAMTRVAAVDLDLLLEQTAEAKNRVNVVILDACRNNPFERKLRGSSSGLAAVDAARGTLVAYATSPGSVASDGGGEHGLYTEELLRALALPGLKIEEVFKRVRVAVAERSKGAQTPWESSSLTGDLIVNLTINVQAAPGPSGAAGAQVPTVVDRDALFWASVKDSTLAADYEAYLRQFPNGTFAELARQRLATLARAAPIAAVPPSAAHGRFDGRWAATVVCAPAQLAQGYKLRLEVEVRDGQLTGQLGTPGQASSLTLTGRIEADGRAQIQARGMTGDSRFAVGRQQPGTPYSYTVVDAKFDERSGSGKRVETRPCELTFVRL